MRIVWFWHHPIHKMCQCDSTVQSPADPSAIRTVQGWCNRVRVVCAGAAEIRCQKWLDTNHDQLFWISVLQCLSIGTMDIVAPAVQYSTVQCIWLECNNDVSKAVSYRTYSKAINEHTRSATVVLILGFFGGFHKIEAGSLVACGASEGGAWWSRETPMLRMITSEKFMIWPAILL